MSASPDAQAERQINEDKPQQPKITFRFCHEWYRYLLSDDEYSLTPPSSNMLYPQEDSESNTLHFTCRTCHYSEPPQSACIYRNELSNAAGETAGITQDIGQDPTVGADFPPDICTICGEEIMCIKCGKPGHDLGFALEVADDDTETTVPLDALHITSSPRNDYDEDYSDPMSDDDSGEWLSQAPSGHQPPASNAVNPQQEHT